jgi:arabinoxylan arabinofuranohydrolase
MRFSNHRKKIIAAGIGFLCLLLAVDILLVRWVRKPNQARVVPSYTENKKLDAEALPRGPRTVFSTIPAPSFDDKEGLRENVGHLGYWDRSTWVRYKAVDFGSGVSSVVAVLSCSAEVEGRILFFHLDSRDGPVVAELQTPATKGFEAVSAPVQGATGLHDVFITCSGGGFNLESIKFLRPQFATNLISAVSYSASRGIRESRLGIVGHTDDGDWIKYDQIDFGQGVSSVAVDLAMGQRDAKVEFRLDAIDGPLIATLTPAPTGDWETFQIQETPVQGANGVHDLPLTFHGGRGLPDIRSIQFKGR